MFPRPVTDTTPVEKISFVTKVGDLGCGVGYLQVGGPRRRSQPLIAHKDETMRLASTASAPEVPCGGRLPGPRPPHDSRTAPA